MARDQKEELERLEAALLEQEDCTAEDFSEETQPDIVDPPRYEDADIYTNAPADVDLDAYSEAVEHGTGRSLKIPAILLVVMTCLFLVVLWLVLKQGGYLG